MLRDGPGARRLLGIAVAVLLVGAVVSIFASDDDGDGSLLASRGGAATTAATGAPAAEDSGATSEPGGGGSVTAPGVAEPEEPAGSSGVPAATAPPPPPGAAGSGEDAEEPQDPGPVTPPRPGSYAYAYSRQSDEGSQDGESTTTVAGEGGTEGDRRQTIRQEREEGSFTSDVAWRGDGSHVLATTIAVGGQELTCDWTPDFRNLAAPLAVGTTWSYQTSCTATFGGTEVEIDRKGDFEVVELARIEIAGEVLDTWKIESVEDTTFGMFGSSREEATSYLSPRHGLPVKTTTRATGSAQGGGSGTATEESVITDLAPR